MAKKNLKPVSLWGVEFDALIDESRTLSATIPAYPVENGFPVSDTIILDPVNIKLTLYISNTPVTWLHRHGSSSDRVKKICDMLEKNWLEKKLAKIVTSDTIYKDMGITSLVIRKSKEIGYAREVDLTAQKVIKTSRKTVNIPSYLLKSGETMANAGTAAVSTSSGKGSYSGSGGSSGSSGSSGGGAGNSGGNKGSGSKGSSGGSDAQKGHSILYGVADGLGWL